jgi:serine phosphatase RsbU (regulator of sigma subunit)
MELAQVLLVLVGAASLGASIVWARSTRYRSRVLRRVEAESGDADAKALARSDYSKDLHTTILYAIVGGGSFVAAFADRIYLSAILLLVVVPVLVSLYLSRNFRRDARIAQGRSELERRAQEVLTQEALAPKRWADRLAPEDLPDFSGFEVGQAYQAGTGMMAGDFYDVFRPAPTRLAAVIGDVAGHGIEPAITAFQAKYLLRVFLRQFRDPAQALEELNRQMSALGRDEEFISLCVILFDTDAGTLRFASAGHPAALLWHEREVRPLRATGPLLMLDPDGSYYSKEIPLESGDLCLVYTDGLAEAREGEAMFGEDRIASTLKRDPGAAPDVLCKSLLEAARDFSGGPISDDVAILAIRRTGAQASK